MLRKRLVEVPALRRLDARRAPGAARALAHQPAGIGCQPFELIEAPAGETHAAGVTVVDEDCRATRLGVGVGRQAADVPAIAHGDQRQDRDLGVLDRVQGAQTWAATQPLKAAGVQLFQNKPGTGVRKVHHKLMVLDERIVIAGSFNYTAPATTLNDENIIVLGDLEEKDPVAEAAQRQVAAYALTEIERIITDLAEPV